jgi:signal transduction histidine kinase
MPMRKPTDPSEPLTFLGTTEQFLGLSTGTWPRRWLAPVLLLLGLSGPMIIATWYTFSLQQEVLEDAFESELKVMTQMLASGMREPVWSLFPESGRPLLESIAEDRRVRAVQVVSNAQGEFLSYASDLKLDAILTTAYRDIIKEGVIIGRVEINMDRSGISESMEFQRNNIIIAIWIQIFVGLAIIIFALRLHGAHFRENELRKINIKLNEEIEERKKAISVMKKAKEEAQFANRSKTEFLANASHELRTPLNAIIGFSEMIEMKIIAPDNAPKYLEYNGHILESGKHLLSLIEEVLEISKIESNSANIRNEYCNLSEIANSCINMTKIRAEENGIDLFHTINSDFPEIIADSRCLKQITTNLLTNSIKFTPSGGQIVLAANLRSDQRIEISITDTGIGMPAEDIPRALEPFTQLNGSSNESQEGAGLGLSLVAALANAHNAKLVLKSELGEGTTVTIIFPLSRTSRRELLSEASSTC